jgi:hypothetical protein
MKKLKLAFAVLLCLLVVVQPVAADWAGDDTSGNGVSPIFETGLPSADECTALGYAYGLKVDANAPNGTYPIQDGTVDGTETKLLGSTEEDLDNSVTIYDSDNYTFSWSSTFGIDAVVVKAGTGANVYSYDDDVMGDTNLHSPLSGDPPPEDPGTIREVSHVAFCWGAPTAVTGPGSSFNAEASAGGRVALTWETSAELDNAGFNLYRALLKDGPYTQINEALIAAQGDPVSGASYSFLDRPDYGTFYYKLEDVNLYGVSTLHGPVKVTLARRPLRSPLYRPSLPEF